MRTHYKIERGGADIFFRSVDMHVGYNCAWQRGSGVYAPPKKFR